MFGATESFGQVAELPVQFSATSQSPFFALHSVVDGLNWSVGQVLFVPSQVSAISQSPATDLQTVVFGATESGGHSTDVPVHFSASSQGPSAALQTVVDGLNLQVVGSQHALHEPSLFISQSSSSFTIPSPHNEFSM